MHISLKGRVALVTGASRGIGRALAFQMAASGAALALCSRQMTGLEEVASEILAVYPGTEILLAIADVSRQEDLARLASSALLRA